MITRKKNLTATGCARNLLIELGTEELPPKALRKLGESFASGIFESLVEADVASPGEGNMCFYASPRRLAVWVRKVAPRQEGRMEERKGPSIKAAFDAEGNPTKAAQGFAHSLGVEVGMLQKQQTEKGAWLVYQQKIAGEKIQLLAQTALEQAIRKLPIARRMRWGDSSQEFVRPVHWLLAMYGSEPLGLSVLGLKSDCWSYGHRFHAPHKLRIMSADRYLKTLKADGMVIADYAERQTLIEKQVNRIAARMQVQAVVDPGLLDEITGLVEWPQALYGDFDRKFLEMPPEVLIASMKDNQKYFPLVGRKGRLHPGFITVSNIKSRSPKRVKSGNERVLGARLADAEFFWRSDQKIPLINRKPALAKVLFHEKLGSILDKVERMRGLATEIGTTLKANQAHIDSACDLCKADLVTDMVGEMPELQGLIGRYYAVNQGEHKKVCAAIEQHYLPRFAGDILPDNHVARSLALADRLDSLAGIFACGEVPTGDKDPYGLRRAALGVLRIMIEDGLALDLKQLLTRALAQFAACGRDNLNTSDKTVDQAFGFVVERLRAYYQPMGYDSSAISAVMSVLPTSPVDFDQRLRAVGAFFGEQKEAAQSLATANKRIANILSKQAESPSINVNPGMLKEKAEIALYEKVQIVAASAGKRFKKGHYRKGLSELAKLRIAVDRFFDEVMVMAEDPDIQGNRLAMLAQIRALFLQVADVSKLRIEQETDKN